MIKQIQITLPSFKRGFHLVTKIILKECGELPEKGLLNLFLKHCSAAITINENADHSVRNDFETILNRIVPEGSYYSHSTEGTDDMPAHIKSSLLGCSLTIPITNKKLNLGIWQGIYLCEFRNYGSNREIIVTIYS